MSHEVLPGPNANIVVFRIYGDLTHADMTCDEALGLNKGRPLLLLLDASKMNVGLPDRFLDGAKQSFFVNDNLIHMAIYLESSMLRAVALMVAKVTHRQDKLSLHESYETALKHLQKMEARELA